MLKLGLATSWRHDCGTLVCLLLAPLFCAVVASADEPSSDAVAPAPTAEQTEFFEKQIRPLLVENCHRCHADKEQKGGLRLDSRAALLTGGDSGPAITPGLPDESLAVEAIRYGADSYQMPPTGKLDDAQIALFERWVADGAPWPGELAGEPAAAAPAEFALAERAKHWAYQPLVDSSPPEVAGATWATTPIDRFLLAGLEAAGFQPAPPLDRAAWLRRVTFDLIGLPPTREDVSNFLSDTSPDAEQRVVDRLLASPHYGERWGRHWLDLVRYGDTMGHEFDYDLFHAWRYRDYVVRAFNADVPYDQFVVEHLAGDLLAEPRRNPVDGANESVLGTGFYWLAEATHSPVDIRQAQADRIDNQIDVLGKTFLAQTIACARCHDHKFDAIRTRDYYALAGYLKSSRYQQSPLDRPEGLASQAARLGELHDAVSTQVVATLLPAWRRQAEQTALALSVAREAAALCETAEAADHPAICARLARERGLDPAQLARWMSALADAELEQPSHPLHAWHKLESAEPGEPFAARRDELVAALSAQQADSQARLERSPSLAVDVSEAGQPWQAWFATGDALEPRATLRPQITFNAAGAATGTGLAAAELRIVPPSTLDTRRLSRRLEGVLRSPTFTIDGRYIHVLAAGRESRLNVIIDGFALIRDPIYGGLSIGLDDDRLAWRTFDVGMWRGHRAYVELVDSPLPNPTQTLPPSVESGSASQGYLTVADVRTSDEPAPAQPPSWLGTYVLAAAPDSAEALAAQFQAAIVAAVAQLELALRDNAAFGEDHAELLNWLLTRGLLDTTSADARLDSLLTDYRALEESLAAPQYGLAMADGTGEDEQVFVRGNYRVLGEPAPRGLLEVLAGPEQPAPATGSGRLELAHRITDPAVNPLLARVMVNRIWQHHFGRGLVATPDDFGRMGERPTHPELLDYLALRFIESGWSVKAMHRLLLASSAYRMSSRASDRAIAADPTNRLWHHVPLRRLEAEAVRDAMLAVSGRLDPALGGQAVMPYIEPGATDRGKPKVQGPLDGAGRRTIYLGVRRNFLAPLLTSFDFPRPITTIGNRGASNTPAQSLALLNNPFVLEQATVWAKRVVAESHAADASQRIRDMYLAAFARDPEDAELIAALDFLARRLAAGDDETTAYGGLAHALFNTKEFVFIE